MFPFPLTFLVTEGGIIPLPDGSVQKVVTLDYTTSGSVQGTTMAILLKDGRLFMQGTNAYGEIADSTRNSRYTNFYLSATGVADVCRGDRCFLVKYNSGGWQYAGLLAGLIGSTAAGGADVVATAWTSLPSAITGTITLANLKEVKGGLNNTIWWMNDGRLYGSGQNTSGSLGSGNTNQVNIPRTISTVALKCEAGENQVTYLNNVGALRVCGMTRGLLGTGSSTTISSFASATVASGLYVKDYVSDITQTLVVGASSATDTVNSMYYRGWNATTYTKLTDFDPGFSTWSFLPGRQAQFFTIGNKLWGIGQNYTGSLGTGTKGSGGGTIVPQEPLPPAETGDKWQIDKINYVNVTNMAVNTTIGYLFSFMLYNGNLYYTGTTVDNNSCPLFNGTLSSLLWVPIPDANIVGTKATAITTDSIGLAIVGGTKQLTYSVTPANGLVQDQQYTTSDPAIMTVNASGLMTFVAEGGFDAGMTAKNNAGETLSDSSGGYASTLSVYTESLDAMDAGATQQLVATISPAGAEDLPGMVVTYTTTDPAIATVDEDGLITAVSNGDCRIGCTATYQGTVTASDSSYLAVNAVAPKPLEPSPATSLTVLNGYFDLPADGSLVFPPFAGSIIASQLSQWVAKVNGAVVPTEKLKLTGYSITTTDVYAAGQYRLSIERASSSVTTRTMSIQGWPALIELWDGNNIAYSTSPASEFLKGCPNLRRITSDCFSNTTYTGTTVSNLLAGCTSLTEIPSGLLKPANFPNATSIMSLAEGCTALTTIPSDLFKNMPKVTKYQYAFEGCTSLATVPAGLFNDLPTNITAFSGIFTGCTGLTDFNQIFADNPGLTVVGQRGALNTAFSGCTNMTGQGVPLTSSLGGATNSGLFRNCTKLSDYASIPSGYK